MYEYTIYCTPEQTKKALNLGAPLEIGEGKGTILCRLQNYHTYKTCVIPTAEQMIGWLEEQEQIDEVVIYKYQRLGRRYWCYDIYNKSVIYKPQIQFLLDTSDDEKCSCVSIDDNRREGFYNRHEATIAAIDAALEYLESLKQ